MYLAAGGELLGYYADTSDLGAAWMRDHWHLVTVGSAMIGRRRLRRTTRDRRVDLRLFSGASALCVGLLVLAMVGSIVCPDQAWVDVSGWMTA